jgi:probable rRNA maturation factor
MLPSEPTPLAAAACRVHLEFEVEDEQPDAWDRERLPRLVTSIVSQELGAGDYALTLHLVSDETIHELNREHREVDSSTDVLSFSLHDPDGLRFVMPPDQPIPLGDVVVSYPHVLAQAEEYGHTPERELAYLVAHGVLHVLGYDHEEPADQAQMRQREEAALEPLGLTR